MEDFREALDRAKEFYGSREAMAHSLRVTLRSVENWYAKGWVPPRSSKLMELETGGLVTEKSLSSQRPEWGSRA